MGRTRDITAEEDIAYLLGKPLTDEERNILLEGRKPLKLMMKPITTPREEYILSSEIAYLSGSSLTAEEVSEIYSRY